MPRCPSRAERFRAAYIAQNPPLLESRIEQAFSPRTLSAPFGHHNLMFPRLLVTIWPTDLPLVVRRFNRAGPWHRQVLGWALTFDPKGDPRFTAPTTAAGASRWYLFDFDRVLCYDHRGGLEVWQIPPWYPLPDKVEGVDPRAVVVGAPYWLRDTPVQVRVGGAPQPMVPVRRDGRTVLVDPTRLPPPQAWWFPLVSPATLAEEDAMDAHPRVVRQREGLHSYWTQARNLFPLKES